MTVDAIEARFDRIDKKLNTLLGDARKPQWVKVTFILLATGWNRERLRQARSQGIVRWEKRKTGYWYDLNSISPLFINK